MTAVKTPISKPLSFSDFKIPKEELVVFEKSLRPDYSPKTHKAIIFDISHFFSFYLGEKKVESLSLNSLTKEDIEAYQKFCKDTLRHAPATIQRRLLHLRQLFQIGVEMKKIRNNPMFKGIN